MLPSIRKVAGFRFRGSGVRISPSAPIVRPQYSDRARGREPPLFALDLQPVGTDIDLQAIGLLLRLVEIVAEHGRRDDQSTDDQKQYVAANRHFLPEPLG